MHKNAALLVFSILAVTPLTVVLPIRMTALPSPLLIAAAILGLVAVFGAVVSLLLRKREKRKKI